MSTLCSLVCFHNQSNRKVNSLFDKSNPHCSMSLGQGGQAHTRRRAFNLEVSKWETDHWKSFIAADRSMFGGKKYPDVFTQAVHPGMQDNANRKGIFGIQIFSTTWPMISIDISHSVIVLLYSVNNSNYHWTTRCCWVHCPLLGCVRQSTCAVTCDMCSDAMKEDRDPRTTQDSRQR